jgi:hypothetical protein
MRKRFAAHFMLLIGLLPLHGGAAEKRATFGPRERLKLILPEVRFDKATLEQAATFLSQKADVNIVIDPAVYASTTQPVTHVPSARQDKQPADATRPAPKNGPVGGDESRLDDSTLITLHLKNVPLEVVLKYILRYKNLRYLVEDYAIVIVPIGRVLPEEMKTQIFRLRTGSPDITRHLRPQAVRSF